MGGGRWGGCKLICTFVIAKLHNSILLIIIRPSTRKTAFCICKNKGVDQLRGNHAADQRLWFHSIDSKISLVPKFQTSSCLQRLYIPHCVGPGWNPGKQVFS